MSYRMPAEWEAHQATWFSWPHNPETWPGCLADAERALAPAIAALAESETVYINVLDAAHARHVRALLPERIGNVELVEIATNDAWCRDHGAIFVYDEQNALTALDFRFNAWGGKYPPFDLDDAAARKMADRLGVPVVSIPIVLEGGSIDVDGRGTVLTTEQCLLNKNRNPKLKRAEIEEILKTYLGVTKIVWLGDGIVGDDTDGHIDDITRFVGHDTIVTVIEPDPKDPNHAPLADNRKRLEKVRLPSGNTPRVIELPMPAPLERDGRRLPASYANFYIGNRVVLLPVFGCPQDEVAKRILADVFPDRRVVAIDCRTIVVGLGTLHCLSQQVPVKLGPVVAG
jgi:agmatine deiminase